MKKAIYIALILTGCQKYSDYGPQTDLFVNPVNKAGQSLCTGEIYLLTADTTDQIQKQDFDCSEESKFYFAGVDKRRDHVVKVTSGKGKGYLYVKAGTGSVTVICK